MSGLVQSLVHTKGPWDKKKLNKQGWKANLSSTSQKEEEKVITQLIFQKQKHTHLKSNMYRTLSRCIFQFLEIIKIESFLSNITNPLYFCSLFQKLENGGGFKISPQQPADELKSLEHGISTLNVFYKN